MVNRTVSGKYLLISNYSRSDSWNIVLNSLLLKRKKCLKEKKFYLSILNNSWRVKTEMYIKEPNLAIYKVTLFFYSAARVTSLTVN